MDWETFYNQFRQKDFIPGYEIQVRLGGGAFGDVYKARKQSIGKSYAIKFLKVEEGQQGVVERELAQVGHFAAIDHPNLVTIEDMGVVQGVPYLIMGYAGNQTLAKRIKQGPIPEDELLDLFHQVARGVARLHDKNLVHFDLKPGNIFLQGGRARVGDYGLAKFFEKGNQTLSFGRGSPHYMAPEIMHGRGDQRADIYSFGIMLYEGCTGIKPFAAPGSDPLALRQESDPLPPTTDLPEAIAQVVETCLAYQPEKRFKDMHTLIAALPPPPLDGVAANSPGGTTVRIAGIAPADSESRKVAPAPGGWVRVASFLGLFGLVGFLLSLASMALMRTLMG